MKHPVVARRHQHGYRVARPADALLNRTDCRPHQPLTIPGFMERRHPGRLTAAQNRLVMTRQMADHKAFFIYQVHARFSVTRGKMLWKASP
ncbi:hypothetical protein MTE2_4869 [Klebsiella pneumoniae VA360]|nr:hypothetical protein MTE2_4869 [Klebsiella pneumoniae VA360]